MRLSAKFRIIGKIRPVLVSADDKAGHILDPHLPNLGVEVQVQLAADDAPACVSPVKATVNANAASAFSSSYLVASATRAALVKRTAWHWFANVGAKVSVMGRIFLLRSHACCRSKLADMTGSALVLPLRLTRP